MNMPTKYHVPVTADQVAIPDLDQKTKSKVNTYTSFSLGSNFVKSKKETPGVNISLSEKSNTKAESEFPITGLGGAPIRRGGEVSF